MCTHEMYELQITYERRLKQFSSSDFKMKTKSAFETDF